MMMRLLSEFAEAGEPEKYFVASLFIACGNDWSAAQRLWEEAVSRAADTVQIRNDRLKAEREAHKWLRSILEILGNNIIPYK